MLRGLYTATAGMISQQRKHDTVTNNISNLNTPGFKAGNAVSRSFPEMLISLTGGESDQASKQIGRLNTGVLAEEDPSIYVQGDLQETKNPFDVALVSDIPMNDAQGNPLSFNGRGMGFDTDGNRVFQPQAFFTVEGADGERRYSRNGKFTVSAAGELSTPEGYRVLGQDGQPIRLVDAAGAPIPDFKMTTDGVLVDSVNGNPLGSRILLTRVNDPNKLIREGNGVYRVSEGQEDIAEELTAAGLEESRVTVRQGFLERSNVDPAQSMIDMNTAMRAYEANQKIIQYYDRSLDKAVNEVGRV